MSWGFYGRQRELDEVRAILSRRRWFFARITGRRRIGKTTLVQRALRPDLPVFYVQIPDSAAAGVLSAVSDAMDTFGIDRQKFQRPNSLLTLARSIQELVLAGYLVALDEFQYFSRKHIFELTSHLQAVVDELSRSAAEVPGGLIVLGSLHTELVALLEDRQAPLYNRTTDQIELDHLDIASVLTILRTHADPAPERLLFLWNLFEGVPKFYRDCYEQGVLAGTREALLARMFFRSSSPLRTEADNWFLSELRGRYDVILKYVARHPGCGHGDLEAHVKEISPHTAEHVGGYLQVLVNKYRMIEARAPVIAKPKARRRRYYLRDNFLRSWLAALHSPVSAINFRPENELVRAADQRLAESEGHALERLAAQLYEERSRKGMGDFRLTARIDGYWNRSDTEIDLVALNEESRTIRFGTCKRNPDRLIDDLATFDGHIARFLTEQRAYQSWTVEKVAIAPRLSAGERTTISRAGYIPQDLIDLTQGL
jgi:hypothetical protein